MKTKQVIIIRKDLNMRKGKIAAQASHAAMSFLTKGCKVDFDKNIFTLEVQINHEALNWLNSGTTKICVSAKDEDELNLIADLAKKKGLTVHNIIDSGFTEFNGVATFTCIAIGPHDETAFEGITDKLPLL